MNAARLLAIVAAVAAVAVLAVQGASPYGGPKTLVMLDSFDTLQSHSLFFADLVAAGYELDYFLADDPELALQEYGEWSYSQAVIFAPAIDDFGGATDVETVLEFIDAGNNVILAASADVNDPTREIASACGVEFDEEGTYVIDHVNYAASDADGEHTVVVANGKSIPVITGDAKGPLLFRGVGSLTRDDPDGLLVELVTGSSSSYSHSPQEAVSEYPHVVGTDTGLVTALQARNNARVLISGSLDLFSNEFYSGNAAKASAAGSSKVASGNQEWVKNVVAWTFQETGLVRHSNVRHYTAADPDTCCPDTYRIKDDVVFEVTVEEWNGKAWVPLKDDGIQLEFVMLDPYVRQGLTHDGKGKYTAALTLPDVYGVFTFKVDYKRLGFTGFSVNELVAVRPFRHDEYPRWLVPAWPYFASAFSMMGGFFVFSVVFLHNKE